MWLDDNKIGQLSIGGFEDDLKQDGPYIQECIEDLIREHITNLESIVSSTKQKLDNLENVLNQINEAL